jgi:hypothetical protein
VKLAEAPFALRPVQRRAGRAAIVYQRQPIEGGRTRLKRIAALGPLAFTAGTRLLRAAVAANDQAHRLAPGPFLALDRDWGARVALYALVADGLRDGDRLARAAEHLRCADPTEAAWWLAQVTDQPRALRALRILVEAVQ